MKRILLALAVLSASTLAQNAHQSTPPPYCKPCLFYGGDFDPNGPLPNALRNQDALTGYEALYVGFGVPPNQTWTVTGVFSNNLAQAPTAEIWPPEIEWSISTGVSQGNPGTVIASGTTKASLTPTGRNWNNMNEYTVLGRLSADQIVTLPPGHYWMTALPVCTYSGPAHCQGQYFFLSDVEDVPAPKAKGFESTDVHFWNAPPTYNFVEVGGPDGICAQQGGGGGCDKFSAGLLGTATLDN